MAKKKTPATPEPQPTRLVYNGKDGYPYLMGIPARDIEYDELVSIALKQECEVADLIRSLTSSPMDSGEKLYSESSAHVCPECDQEFDDWNALHKHTIEEHTETPTEEEPMEDNT